MTTIPQGFLEARYPWMTVQGSECYPSRDFLYLILALWQRTGGASGISGSTITQLTSAPVFLGDEGGSGDDEAFLIPGPRGAQGVQGIPGVPVVLDAPEPEEPMLIYKAPVGAWYDEKGLGGTYGFAAGVDFTAGTSTTLTLSQPYGSQANLIVAFDGAWQGADQFSLSGKTLTFTSAIPVGTNKVFVKGFLTPQ